MQSGVTFTYASMIDGMIERIKQEEGLEELTVVATGGLAKAIVPLCFNEIITDEFLTLKGILQVYLKNNCVNDMQKYYLTYIQIFGHQFQ